MIDKFAYGIYIYDTMSFGKLLQNYFDIFLTTVEKKTGSRSTVSKDLSTCTCSGFMYNPTKRDYHFRGAFKQEQKKKKTLKTVQSSLEKPLSANLICTNYCLILILIMTEMNQCSVKEDTVWTSRAWSSEREVVQL